MLYDDYMHYTCIMKVPKSLFSWKSEKTWKNVKKREKRLFWVFPKN